MSLFTIEPAPTMQLLPTLTLGNTNADVPMKVFEPIFEPPSKIVPGESSQ